MPRQARLDAPGTLHHVMIRGIEGREIFRDDVDRRGLPWSSRDPGCERGGGTLCRGVHAA